MAAIYNQVLLHWTDVNGRNATTFWTTLDQGEGGAGAYSALAAAAQALSVAALKAIQFQTTVHLATDPTTGAYQSVTDRGVFLARMAPVPGSTLYAVPAPKESILLPGNEVIDLSNPDVVAFFTQMNTFIGDTTGHAVSQFVRGTRQRARGGA